MSRRPDHLGKRKEFSALVKRQARERADYTCQYPGCDRLRQPIDHILPQGLAFIQGKTSHDYPRFRGSRVQQLRQMKAWIRGWRNAKKIRDAKP